MTPSLQARLVPPDAEEWSALLDDVAHDIYHLPGYVSVSARADGGRPAALLVTDDARRLLVPLVIRDLPGGLLDATSPYGYPGLLTDEREGGFITEAMAAGVAHLGEQGFVSVFIRLHPLLDGAGLAPCGVVVEHGRTVVIDLSLDEASLWSQTSRNHRQDICRAEGEGVAFSFRDDDATFEAFKRLYLGTMSWRNAADYYLFDEDYFDALRSALGSRLHLAAVTIDERTAAVGMVTTSCGMVQIHLAGWDQELAHHRPMKVLIHGVRRWAHDRGERWLHLGGGLGARDDGLLRFKLGFSPLTVPFQTIRIVVDDRSYRSLAAAREGDVDVADHRGFFPIYREAQPDGRARPADSDARSMAGSTRVR